MMFYSNKIRNHQKGATTLEFAIVAVFLLVLLFLIIELSLIFLQGHYVSNAAREGARIGVRANTYDCMNGTPLLDYNNSPCLNDRTDVVRQEVRNYLDILYDTGDLPDENITVEYEIRDKGTTGLTEDVYMLSVTVEAPYLFTNIAPRLFKATLLKANTDAKHPNSFSFKASIELEDQEEYDPDI